MKATYNSVTFTLKTANAARFGYKVDVPDGTAELTFVNGSEGGTYTTDNLEAATDYQITAVAYDENGQAADPSPTHSKPKPFRPAPPSFRSKRSLRPQFDPLHPETRQCGPDRLQGRCPRRNSRNDRRRKPQQSTFLVGSLQAETDYVLTVVAYNGKDEPSEPATHSFTTPPIPHSHGSTPWRPHTESISRPTWTPANSALFPENFRPGPYGIQRRFRRAFQGRFRSSSSITSKSPH